MKRKGFLLVLFICAILATSCTSVRKTISTGYFQDLKIEPLKESQYDVIHEVEGYGEATQFLFFGAFSKFSKERGVVGKALGKATYDAISKVEGADMLIAPKYEVEYSNFLIIKTATVRVKSKAIQIKTTK
jgi:hypothetical protein